jgi:hypothetical protein
VVFQLERRNRAMIVKIKPTKKSPNPPINPPTSRPIPQPMAEKGSSMTEKVSPGKPSQPTE